MVKYHFVYVPYTQLRGEDGAELLLEVKSSSDPKKVIVVPGDSSRRSNELYEAGADFCFEKGDNISLLIDKIEELCPPS